MTPWQKPEKDATFYTNFFKKIARTFLKLLPCDTSQAPNWNCSEKLAQMNFFIVGGFSGWILLQWFCWRNCQVCLSGFKANTPEGGVVVIQEWKREALGIWDEGGMWECWGWLGRECFGGSRPGGGDDPAGRQLGGRGERVSEGNGHVPNPGKQRVYPFQSVALRAAGALSFFGRGVFMNRPELVMRNFGSLKVHLTISKLIQLLLENPAVLKTSLTTP